ncbi:unnamed protein product [Gemmata massiliana]|uniref:Beta-xylosidase C-terminal Concanavalin A-like domain-containing protein n=1 Tax=Gemmata massiliana TaxID=1210884 RepID=A0A6P2DJ71_9BACT|nr:DUF1349 domain-containing protein [Gemmata massiliana]VTS02748.1 unnamed protein product [Gemmata massiliana]
MIRAAAVVAFVVTAVGVSAAPVPPPTEKELLTKYWGKTEGQGEFELAGKQLTVRTVGQPARGMLYGKNANMPRATKPVTGDFEVTVKLGDATPPNPKNQHEDSWPGSRAGLIVSGDGYSIEFHLYQYHTKRNGEVLDKLNRVVWVDTWFPGGGAGGSREQVPVGKSTYLRITRKDKTVSVSHSFDGKEWSVPHVPRQDLAFPDDVSVGVFYSHSTYQIATATFDELTITKPKAEPKDAVK